MEPHVGVTRWMRCASVALAEAGWALQSRFLTCCSVRFLFLLGLFHTPAPHPEL